MAKCLPVMQEARGSTPSLHKIGLQCPPLALEGEAGRQMFKKVDPATVQTLPPCSLSSVFVCLLAWLVGFWGFVVVLFCLVLWHCYLLLSQSSQRAQFYSLLCTGLTAPLWFILKSQAKYVGTHSTWETEAGESPWF